MSIIFLISGATFAEDLSSGDTLLKGFIKWQAGRVEKAALDTAISNIANDPHIERFFPLTSNEIKLYRSNTSARRLIPQMQYNIEQDIEKLNGILSSCIPYNVNSWVKDIDESKASIDPKNNTLSISLSDNEQREIYINVVELMINLYNISSRPDLPYKVEKNKSHGLVTIDIDKDKNNYSISDFYEKVCPDPDLLDTKHKLSDKLKDEIYISAVVFSVLKMAEKYNSLQFDAEGYKSNIKLASEIKFPSIGSIPSEINSYFSSEYIKELTSALLEFNKISQKFNDDDVPFVVKATSLFSIIEQFTPPDSKDISGFIKLKSTTIFLSSLVDAGKSGEPDSVVAVLDSYIDDVDVMNRKRSENSFIISYIDYTTYDGTEDKVKTSSWRTTCHIYKIFPCENTIFIGSYYGVSYANYKKEMGMEKEWHPRAFGPVGIEFKLSSIKSKPISLMYAPFDIGNYVTNELSDQEYSASFSDIVAPSVFLSYTVRGKPISFLLGYQWDMKLAEDFESEGPFISIAYDLPIFTLY